MTFFCDDSLKSEGNSLIEDPSPAYVSSGFYSADVQIEAVSAFGPMQKLNCFKIIYDPF